MTANAALIAAGKAAKALPEITDGPQRDAALSARHSYVRALQVRFRDAIGGGGHDGLYRHLHANPTDVAAIGALADLIDEEADGEGSFLRAVVSDLRTADADFWLRRVTTEYPWVTA